MWELYRVFLKIGLTSFGGPMAAIGLMKEEFRKRNWVSEEKFQEFLIAVKLFPGPIATQMALLLAQEKFGRKNAILASLFYLGPAFLLVLAFAAFYFTSHAVIEQGRGFFSGFQIAALAVMTMMSWQMFKTLPRKAPEAILILCSATLTWHFPQYELLLILGFGFLGVLLSKIKPTSLKGIPLFELLLLFWVCFKAGAFVFGSGLAVVPFLAGDVIHKYQWLTEREFLDGLVIGQMTPGPVVITTTFIGYHVAGVLGALTATFGIFLPSYINTLVLFPRYWKRIHTSQNFISFSRFALPTIIGSLIAIIVKMFLPYSGFPAAYALWLVVMSLQVWFKMPAWLLIIASGPIGFWTLT